MRIPYAGQQLVKQVLAEYPDAAHEVTGDVDGLGWYRSVTFDEATSQSLEPVLAVLEDARIQSIASDDDGALTVTFVADNRADSREPFLIPEVRKVLEAPKATKKTAAKKTAKKP